MISDFRFKILEHTILRKHWHTVGVIVVLVIAIFLRFYNYSNRWGLAYDQAHDAIIARHALQQHLIPLVGPFSSAGPFQTGGEWYWIIMLGTSLYPFKVITPWLFITGLSLLFVYLMIRVGTRLMDRKGGLLAGLLSAVSTAQLAQSTNMTNQTPEAIIALGALWSAIAYIRKRTAISLFWLGFFISFAATVHLQGAALAVLLPVALLLGGIPPVRHVLAVMAGFSLPLLPLIIFDVRNDFVNSRGFIRYLTDERYKIPYEVLGRRWLTYAGEFFPRAWAYTIGGSVIAGYLFIVAVGALGAARAVRKTLSREWIFIGGSTVFMTILVRYIRTPLYPSYLTFMHPFILLLSAWVLWNMWNRHRLIGLAACSSIVVITLMYDWEPDMRATNHTAEMTSGWANELALQDGALAVYDRGLITRDKSVPLVLFLDGKGKIADDGKKIGVMIASQSSDLIHKPLIGKFKDYQVFDLSASSSAELGEAMWFFVNPSELYWTTEHWYRHPR